MKDKHNDIKKLCILRFISGQFPALYIIFQLMTGNIDIITPNYYNLANLAIVIICSTTSNIYFSKEIKTKRLQTISNPTDFKKDAMYSQLMFIILFLTLGGFGIYKMLKGNLEFYQQIITGLCIGICMLFVFLLVWGFKYIKVRKNDI